MPELSRIRRGRSRSERFLVRIDIVAAAFVIATLAHAEPAAALVGADLADLSLQRYTVSVASSKGKCTGVVLAQDIVLTAAHCVENGPLAVTVSFVVSGTQQDHPVRQIEIDPRPLGPTRIRRHEDARRWLLVAP